MLENLKHYKILLASKSPRRRELLSQLRIDFTPVCIGNIKEDYPADLPAEEVPEFLSLLKARNYAKILKNDELIITADTVVICDGQILGKPKDTDDAVGMLLTLSGKTHKVVTGVSITTLQKQVTFRVSTDVTFSEITPREATYYVDNYMPLDKAGAYGIQEWIGCIAVEKIDGSFYNVMGLPVHRLYRELLKF